MCSDSCTSIDGASMHPMPSRASPTPRSRRCLDTYVLQSSSPTIHSQGTPDRSPQTQSSQTDSPLLSLQHTCDARSSCLRSHHIRPLPSQGDSTCLQRHRSQGKSPAAASSLASSSARRWRLLPLARCPHCQPSPSLSDPRQRSTSTPCHIREYHRRTGVASVSALAPVLALPMAPALAHQSVLLSVLPSESSLAEPSDLVSPRTTFYCSALSCAPPDTRTRSSSPHCHMIRPARSCCRPMDPT